MRGSFLGLGFLTLVWLLPALAMAQPQGTCAAKVLDSGTVEGLYGGVICVDFCRVSIRLDNGKEFSLLEGRAEAEELFGKIGNRVSATYELQQFWNDFADECARTEVLTSGKIIEIAQPAEPPTSAAPASTPFKLGAYALCLENANNGADCLKPNNAGVGFARNFNADQTGSDAYDDHDLDGFRAFVWRREGSTITLSFQNGEEKQGLMVKDNLLFEGGAYYLHSESVSRDNW
ncbi:MAG: hypothetical protein LBJ64_10110 [Deltaproteobacteria bacterium]|jgi:hypothetical protein|nr:hypothetical protein [Deltaproteobacteria bacterium]